MIHYFLHREGVTRQVESIDPAWLSPESNAYVWADVHSPDAADASLLRDVFQFHPLAVEDALQSLQFPKIEVYPAFLYVVLHGIDFQASKHRFGTHDVDFFRRRRDSPQAENERPPSFVHHAAGA